MRYCLFFLLLILLSGCANINKLNKLSIGLESYEVPSKMGKPSTEASTGNTIYYIYYLYETDWDAFMDTFFGYLPWWKPKPYFVQIKNYKVSAYGRMGDFDSTKDESNVNKFYKVYNPDIKELKE